MWYFKVVCHTDVSHGSVAFVEMNFMLQNCHLSDQAKTVGIPL